MESALQTVLTIVASVGASSGFWAYFTARTNKKTASYKLLIGLAYDRIVYVGMKYVHRGWISKDEYDSLIRNLYRPYKEVGGNGLVERVMKQIDELPLIKPNNQTGDEDEN